MKYSLSPRDFPRAQIIFHSISRLESQYRHSHLANNGHALAVAYAEVIAVSGNVDIALAVVDCFCRSCISCNVDMQPEQYS